MSKNMDRTEQTETGRSGAKWRAIPGMGLAAASLFSAITCGLCVGFASHNGLYGFAAFFALASLRANSEQFG